MENNMENVKVHFELEIGDDGYPPITVESLNAKLINETTVELDNTPFFVDSVASGDILEVEKTDTKGIYKFCRVLTESGSKALSIIFIDNSVSEELYQYLKYKDCYCEYGEFKDFNMLAVSVDKDQDYSKIISRLLEMEKEELISVAELAI